MHRSFRSIGLWRSSFSSKVVSQRTHFKSQYKFSSQSSSTTNFSSFNKFLGASLLIGSAAFLTQQIHAESQQEEEIFKTAGARKDGLKDYTLEEIAKHNNKDARIWVIYKNGVYDITDFIEMHPGQEKILQAAGTSIEPFWAMYSQHLTPEILEMLEELRIGNLAPNQQMSAVLDAYAADPGNRSSVLVVRSKKPFNAETPPEVLVQSLVTPNELFFVRNHLPVPIVNPKDYVLEITADTLQQPIRLTLDDLKKFPKAEVMATIQCAGNRRNEMTRIKEVKGGFWETGAISNAVWTGVKLRDVLIFAGINPDDLKGMEHVQFTGLDKDFEKSYGASIPIDKALSTVGDVILAFEMNGKELPPDHGYPVRVVVPGTVGARNVKWLHRIHASKEESSSHWQQKDYKGFSPNIDWHNVNWDSAPAIQEFPVQSAICVPANGAVLPKSVSDVTVKGFAWSGGGRGIVRVDVSVDGGKTWHTADLQGSGQRYNRVWAWSLWEVKVPVPENSEKLDICCKAVDSSYNGQPEKVEPIWNLRGVLSNAWHHVNVTVDK